MTTFFGALAAVSAAMPNVTVQVRQKNYSTNAYFCVIGPAELAGIAMNETQGYSYKSSPKVTVKFPKLTILATGTPSQYVSFIGNTHAGMESRVHTLLVASEDG